MAGLLGGVAVDLIDALIALSDVGFSYLANGLSYLGISSPDAPAGGWAYGSALLLASLTLAFVRRGRFDGCFRRDLGDITRLRSSFGQKRDLINATEGLFSTALAIGAGSVGGRFGPAASFASAVSGWLVNRITPLQAQTASLAHSHSLVTASAVAGAFAALLGAPFAGAVFAFEVILQGVALRRISGLLVASFCGWTYGIGINTPGYFGLTGSRIFTALGGNHDLSAGRAAEVPSFITDASTSWEGLWSTYFSDAIAGLLPCLFLGGLLAIAATLSLHLTCRILTRLWCLSATLQRTWPYIPFAHHTGGAPLTSGIILFLLILFDPGIAQDGVGFIGSGMDSGTLVTLGTTQIFTFLALKWVALIAVLGFGFGGGATVPFLVLGGLLGLGVGQLVSDFGFLTGVNAQMATLLGIVIFAGAGLGAPLALTLMLLEWTGDVMLAATTLPCALLASILLEILQGDDYFSFGQRMRYFLPRGRRTTPEPPGRRVRDLMHPAPLIFDYDEKVPDLLDRFRQAPGVRLAYVIRGKNKPIGYIARRDVQEQAALKRLPAAKHWRGLIRLDPTLIESDRPESEARKLLSHARSGIAGVTEAGQLIGEVHLADLSYRASRTVRTEEPATERNA